MAQQAIMDEHCQRYPGAVGYAAERPKRLQAYARPTLFHQFARHQPTKDH